MRIDLYAACLDEMPMLDFFFRHYDPIVDRYFIYDDGSTDGSIERLKAHPKVTLRQLEHTRPDSVVLSLLDLYNDGWKESRGAADWVIVTNIDEHLYHPDLAGYLATSRDAGVTLIPALGYQMISERFPPPEAVLARDLTQGAPIAAFSKLSLFDPSAIKRVRYKVGRHRADPTGKVVYPDRDELLLLHYKYLGVSYAKSRNQALGEALKSEDIAKDWGHHYRRSDKQFDAQLAVYLRHLTDVTSPDLRPWDTHSEPRWWREAGNKQG